MEGRAVVGDEVLGASQAAEAAVGHQRSQLGNKVTVSAGNARANGGKVALFGMSMSIRERVVLSHRQLFFLKTRWPLFGVEKNLTQTWLNDAALSPVSSPTLCL